METYKHIKNIIFYISINTICIYFLGLNNTGEDDLSSTGDKVGNAGKRIACGVISEKVDEGLALWILIIILAVVIFFVIAILICLICYCKRYFQ